MSTNQQPTDLETMAFIYKAHRGQVDKGGIDYWMHPVLVAHRLGNDATETERLVALLHDVIEDTKYTADDLRARGYSKEVVDAVVLLSRPKGDTADCRLGDQCRCVAEMSACPMWETIPRPTYREWIRKIAASGNLVAIKVKIADSEENSRPDRTARMPESERGVVKRYEWAIPVLKAALEKLQ